MIRTVSAAGGGGFVGVGEAGFAFGIALFIELFLLVDEFADRVLDEQRDIDGSRWGRRIMGDGRTVGLRWGNLLQEEFGSIQLGQDGLGVEWSS